MSELTGHSSGWVFQNPEPSGHWSVVSGAVVVVVEMLVVAVGDVVLDVDDEVVIVVGRVVVVVVEVVVGRVVVVGVVVDVVVVVGPCVLVVVEVVVVEVVVVELVELVVVGGRVVVVGGRVVVVVVVVDGEGPVVDVVLVAMVVLVVDVVVDPVPVTETLQPVPVAGRIGSELVSKRVVTVRPMAVVALAVAATLKVIMATLTTPVGNVRLELWKAGRLVVPGVGVFVVGLPENWAVLPPATDATVRRAGSYVTAIE